MYCTHKAITDANATRLFDHPLLTTSYMIMNSPCCLRYFDCLGPGECEAILDKKSNRPIAKVFDVNVKTLASFLRRPSIDEPGEDS